MKTSVVVFALLVGGILPAYSQLNPHRKIERSPDPRFQKLNKDSVFGHDKPDSKLNDSWHAWTPFDLRISPAEPTPNTTKGSNYSRDLMPVLKPEGTFHMRLHQPEGKFTMRTYLLDW